MKKYLPFVFFISLFGCYEMLYANENNTVAVEITFKSDVKSYEGQKAHVSVRQVDGHEMILPDSNKNWYDSTIDHDGIARFKVVFPEGERWVRVMFQIKEKDYRSWSSVVMELQVDKEDVAFQLNPEEMKLFPRPNITPKDYPNLPYNIASKLDQTGCTIIQPQDVDFAFPSNVVRGDFSGDGTEDWAAYCLSKDKLVSIEVVWGDKQPACSQQIYSESDTSMIGDIALGVSNMKDVRHHQLYEDFYFEYREKHGVFPNDEQYQAYLESLPPPKVFWSGIDEYYIGKAGHSYYCVGGKWSAETTSD
ncbi:hypothetical protein JYT13_00375 [Mariprofundus ferrooxydans]|nr:hypothetical protein [Mariprofundus ferrooxydans]